MTEIEDEHLGQPNRKLVKNATIQKKFDFSDYDRRTESSIHEV